MLSWESNTNSPQLHRGESSPVFPWGKRQVGGDGGKFTDEVRMHRGSHTHFQPLAFCKIFQRQLSWGRVPSSGGLRQCGQQQHRYQSLQHHGDRRLLNTNSAMNEWTKWKKKKRQRKKSCDEKAVEIYNRKIFDYILHKHRLHNWLFLMTLLLWST